MNMKIRCEVREGVFSGEWLVSITSEEGNLMLYVDRSYVHMEQEPDNGNSVHAELTVGIVETGDYPLVQLPVGSSPTASRVRVSQDQLVA